MRAEDGLYNLNVVVYQDVILFQLSMANNYGNMATNYGKWTDS